MTLKTLEIDLTESERLRLVCRAFKIPAELVADIQAEGLSHEETIYKIILSEAVSRALTEMIGMGIDIG